MGDESLINIRFSRPRQVGFEYLRDHRRPEKNTAPVMYARILECLRPQFGMPTGERGLDAFFGAAHDFCELIDVHQGPVPRYQ
jgi:hypothetical protein